MKRQWRNARRWVHHLCRNTVAGVTGGRAEDACLLLEKCLRGQIDCDAEENGIHNNAVKVLL